jgi:hypothetical protein
MQRVPRVWELGCTTTCAPFTTQTRQALQALCSTLAALPAPLQTPSNPVPPQYRTVTVGAGAVTALVLSAPTSSPDSTSILAARPLQQAHQSIWQAENRFAQKRPHCLSRLIAPRNTQHQSFFCVFLPHRRLTLAVMPSPFRLSRASPMPVTSVTPSMSNCQGISKTAPNEASKQTHLPRLRTAHRSRQQKLLFADFRSFLLALIWGRPLLGCVVTDNLTHAN